MVRKKENVTEEVGFLGECRGLGPFEFESHAGCFG